MNTYAYNLFLSAAAIAGVAVIWRNLIEDHPTWKSKIKQRLGIFGKSILCGSCFTYWLSLFLTLMVQPLASWMPLASSAAGYAGDLFLRWMALSWLAAFLRFAYVALQELVHYQVHHLRGDHRHD